MDLILLLIGLLLILGTGFFVAVEFSLVALETATVQQAKDSGDKAADAVLRCLKTLSTQLSSCQIGITITSREIITTAPIIMVCSWSASTDTI